MTKTNQKIKTKAGIDDEVDIALTQADGSPIDLTGLTVVWSFEHEGVVVTKDSDAIGGITITDLDGGLCKLTIGHADTQGLCGVYKHELWLVDATNKRVKELEGPFVIDESIYEA